MVALRKLFTPAILLATLAARADSGLGTAFDFAAATATRKLGDPGCLLVLSDFSDASGRPLAERLSNTGLSARDYFEQLDFRRGLHEPTCQRSRVDAFTQIGRGTRLLPFPGSEAATIIAPKASS